MAAQIQAMGIGVYRIFGATRQGTATAMASFATKILGWNASQVFITRGDSYPDALAGGPLAGSLTAPILLTDSPSDLGSVPSGYLSASQGTVPEVSVLGGTAAVTDSVWGQAEQAAGDTVATNEVNQINESP